MDRGPIDAGRGDDGAARGVGVLEPEARGRRGVAARPHRREFGPQPGRVHRRRQNLLVERQAGLDQPRGPARRPGVADLPAHRGERRRGGARLRLQDRRERVGLGPVVERAAGRRDLEVLDTRRVNRRVGAGAHQRRGVGGRVGSEAVRAAAARRPDPANHGVHPVAVALGVGQPLEHQRPGPLPRQDARGGHLERGRPPGRRVRPLRLVGPDRPRVAGEVHAAADRPVEFPAAQGPHRQLDGPRRGTLLAAHRETRPAEAERPGDAARGDAAERAHRAVRAQRRADRVGQQVGPLRRRERRRRAVGGRLAAARRPGREGLGLRAPTQVVVSRVQVEAQADEHAGARVAAGRGRLGVGRGPLAVVERRRGDLEHQQLLRQHLAEFLGRDAEAVERDDQLLDEEPRRAGRVAGQVPRRLGRGVGPVAAAERVLLKRSQPGPRPEVRRQPHDRDRPVRRQVEAGVTRRGGAVDATVAVAVADGVGVARDQVVEPGHQPRRRQRRGRRRRLGLEQLRGAAGVSLADVLLDEQVPVDAAEAEAADRGAARQRRPPRVPLLELRRHAQGAAVVAQLGVRRVEVRLRRPGAVADRQQDFDECRGPRPGEQVADGGLDRADDALPRLPRPLGRAAPQLGQTLELDRVADGRTRGVALDQVGEVGLPAGLRVGRPHRPQLPLLGRREQVAVHVVRHAGAAQNPVDLVARAQGVGQPLEHEHAGPFADDQAVRRRVERRAPTARRQRPELREAHLRVQAVRPRRPAGEHRVGPPAQQFVAGQLDRVDRRGARRVEGERPAADAQRLRQQPGRQARDVAVQRVRAARLRRQPRGPVGAVAEVLARQVRRLLGRQADVAEHHPHAARVEVARDRGAVGAGAHVKDKVEQRVEAGEQVGRQTHVGRVEVERVEVVAARRVDGVGVGDPGVAAGLRRQQPAALGHLTRAIDAAGDVVPEQVEVGPRAGEARGHPDNRDALGRRHSQDSGNGPTPARAGSADGVEATCGRPACSGGTTGPGSRRSCTRSLAAGPRPRRPRRGSPCRRGRTCRCRASPGSRL